MKKETTERELPFKFARDRLFCVVGFDAVRLQVSAELPKMLVVSRFNRTKDVDLGKVRTGEGALVHNLF